VLGTDGRASNPDLGMLGELRQVARHHPTQAPATIVRLATLAGAQALGRSRWNGSITAGKHANLTAVAIPDGQVRDPYEAVLGGDGPVVATFFHGRSVAPHVDLPPRMVAY
jgi:5-methylthioadenosine/S-adenosylhomocysteine deaminase